MEPRLSFVTLGVADLKRATDFYARVLRLPQLQTPPTIAFFELGRTYLALYPRGGSCRRCGIARPRPLPLPALSPGLPSRTMCARPARSTNSSPRSRPAEDASCRPAGQGRIPRVLRLLRRPRRVSLGSRVQSAFPACVMMAKALSALMRVDPRPGKRKQS